MLPEPLELTESWDLAAVRDVAAMVPVPKSPAASPSQVDERPVSDSEDQPDVVTGDGTAATAGSSDSYPHATEAVTAEHPESALLVDGPLPPTHVKLTQIDWARELLDRARWSEAESILSQLVEEASLPVAEIDSVLEEATRLSPTAELAWKLLGDFRMRTSRPQAAAEAYLMAADHVSTSE